MSAWERREQRIQTVALVAVAIVAAVWALNFLRPVMIPLVLATFLTYALAPLIDVQVNRLKFPRLLAVGTTFALGVGVVLLLAVLVGMSVSAMTDSRELYEQQTRKFFYDLATSLQLDPSVDRPLQDLVERIQGETSISVHGVVEHVLKEAADVLATLLLVVIFLLFMILGKNPSDGNMDEVEAHIRTYIVVKTGIALLAGVLHGLVLWTLGVEPAVVFGVLTFALTFIPSIGPSISVLLPIPVLPLAGLSLEMSAVAILIPLALNVATGNVLEPRVMGKSLQLHPVTILVALIFFGMVWGIVGMFLATPLVAVLKMVLDKSKETDPFARALEGDLGALGAYFHHPSTEDPQSTDHVRVPHSLRHPPKDDTGHNRSEPDGD